jgi:hypothetical protein
MAEFQGKAPGGGAGEMSHRTKHLRPVIALRPGEIAEARRLRRQGEQPEEIASALGVATEEVEKALVQMRSPRPETTRGTINVTLAAHRVFHAERVGREPVWKTVDRMIGELLQLRAEKEASATRTERRATKPQASQLALL